MLSDVSLYPTEFPILYLVGMDLKWVQKAGGGGGKPGVTLYFSDLNPAQFFVT